MLKTVCLVLVFLLALLPGCSASAPATEAPAEAPVEAPAETPAEVPAEAPAEAPAETPAEAPALMEYVAETVGACQLPEGFSMEVVAETEGPLPRTLANFTKGDITVMIVRYGTDAYEAAGVPLPADLEEYATRPGVLQGIPEGSAFAPDSCGSLHVAFTRDGEYQYQVLLKGAESYGNLFILCPEGQETPEDFALWASKATLE